MAYAQSAGPDAPMQRQMNRAMRAEMLDAETEAALFRAWHDHGDERALHRLITAYMRLAISMAAKFRRYGLSMNDLIQEAGVGLMKAANKFDPDRGVRFSTYATWWIKASIQDYVMRNWSMVRTGSTAAQKTLFFSLRRLRAEAERTHGLGVGAPLTPELRQNIAAKAGVSLRDLDMMEARLSGPDVSLNVPQTHDEGREWLETIADESDSIETSYARDRDGHQIADWLHRAMAALPAREQLILRERQMREEPQTLEALGQRLGLSKERVRQLEAQAMARLRQGLEAEHGLALRDWLRN